MRKVSVLILQDSPSNHRRSSTGSKRSADIRSSSSSKINNGSKNSNGVSSSKSRGAELLV